MRLHTLATAIAVYVASSHANTNALRSTSKFPLSSVLSTWDTAFVYRSLGKHCRSPQLSGQKRRSTELLASGLNLHDYSNSANSTLPMVQHHHHIFTEEILPEEVAYASKQHAHLAMPPGVGFALDVDGVLCRGGEVIKGAPAAIRLLQQHNIPHIYLTNSGGHTEAAKAAQLSVRLGVTVTPDQVQMSHTPLRFLPDEVKRQRVLVVGKANAAEILAGYGFTDVVTADEYHALHPELWPDAPPAVALSPAARRAGRRRPLQAAVVLTAPANWYRDLQLLVDALRSPDGRAGGDRARLPPRAPQRLACFLAGPDLEYPGPGCRAPRLGDGAFLAALEHLYAAATRGGAPLRATVLGKPHAVSYRCAEALLARQRGRGGAAAGAGSAAAGGGGLRIYGVGDNPTTDVRGANAAGGAWRSALVQTGMWVPPARGGKGEEEGEEGFLENSREDPAALVASDVYAAVVGVLGAEGLVEVQPTVERGFSKFFRLDGGAEEHQKKEQAATLDNLHSDGDQKQKKKEKDISNDDSLVDIRKQPEQGEGYTSIRTKPEEEEEEEEDPYYNGLLSPSS